MDNANANIGCSEGDGDEMHCFNDVNDADDECVGALEMMNIAGFVFDLYVELAQRPWNVKALA